MKPHPILLRAPRELDPASGTRPTDVDSAPAILQRSDEDFVDAVIESLRSSAGRTGLTNSLAAARSGGMLKLFQPVQRQFHVALLEAVCLAPGSPRVDPNRIESAGMVLRRIPRGGSVREGWMRSHGKLRGWIAIDADTDARYDPLPSNRLARKAVGPPALARELVSHAAQAPGALLAEHVIPLFLAPPDVCADAGKTLYYGVVPTTSSELSEAPGEMPSGFDVTSAAFRNHLEAPLRGDAMTFPGKPGEEVKIAWRKQADIPPDQRDHAPFVTKFVQLLRQLAIEFDAFGDSKASTDLFTELQTIALPLLVRSGDIRLRTVPAGTFLAACVPVLLEGDGNAPAPEMPTSWPALSAAAAGRLAAALSAALAERFKTVQGKAGRFDQAGASYQIRAFIRLKPECGCPSRTVWSGYSEPFTIAPWYDGPGASPVQIPLPDATNRSLLKSLKPNVAFVVPPALNNLLTTKGDDLLKGNGKASSSPDLQWICSFNIPTITICAFICLNIILSIFDLIFGWLAFIKICIPFPKIGSGGGS